jgi:acetoin utilization protein AcuB
VLVNEIMTENPMTIRDTASVGDAVRLLRTLDVRHLPVVDDADELVGMVSDRDLGAGLAEAAVEQVLGPTGLSSQTPIRAVMSSDVLSVEEDDDVGDAVELMLEHKVGAVPVVDGEGKLSGIVSYMDVLRELAEKLD